MNCQPETQRCTDSHVETCSNAGAWESPIISTLCGECAPNATDCNGSSARLCSALGIWEEQPCSGAQPLCAAATGRCACTPTSCADWEVCDPSGSCDPLPSDCPALAPIGVPGQEIAIARVDFNRDGSADVVFQHLGAGSVSYSLNAEQLCNSGSCGSFANETTVTLTGSQAFPRHVANVLVSGGELAVVRFNADGSILGKAYVAWGSGGGAGSLEASINGALPLWVPGERISIPDGETGFVATGDTSRSSGYTACHP